MSEQIRDISISYIIDDAQANFVDEDGEQRQAKTLSWAANHYGVDVTAFSEGAKTCVIWWVPNDMDKIPDWVPTPPEWFAEAAKGIVKDDA